MQLRSGRKVGTSQRPRWDHLPPEIRLMILEWTAGGCDWLPSKGGKQHKFAIYATINEEWRAFFEKKTFRCLRLLPTCLGEFERLVTGRRRSYLRQIWFRTRLRMRANGRRFGLIDMVKSRMVFSTGIAYLFEILAPWTDEQANPEGLALELSAFSSIGPDRPISRHKVSRSVEGLDVWTDGDELCAVYDSVPAKINRESASEVGTAANSLSRRRRLSAITLSVSSTTTQSMPLIRSLSS